MYARRGAAALGARCRRDLRPGRGTACAGRHGDRRVEELVTRYEAPSSMNRWDRPLFVLTAEDPLPRDAIAAALFQGKAPNPNLATRPVRATTWVGQAGLGAHAAEGMLRTRGCARCPSPTPTTCLSWTASPCQSCSRSRRRSGSLRDRAASSSPAPPSPSSYVGVVAAASGYVLGDAEKENTVHRGALGGPRSAVVANGHAVRAAAASPAVHPCQQAERTQERRQPHRPLCTIPQHLCAQRLEQSGPERDRTGHVEPLRRPACAAVRG